MEQRRRDGSTRVRLKPPEDPRPRLDVGPPFRRLNGGWLALDFVNTVAGWGSNPEQGGGRDWGDRIEEERLVRYEDLVAWARLEDLIDVATAESLLRVASGRPADAEEVIVRARCLRAALFRLFRATVDAWPPLDADVQALNGELERLRHGERLVRSGGGFAIEWMSERAVLEALLWLPLRSAVALLTRAEILERVGQCGGAGCGWFFVDVGRGRSRRWCDIRDCGNVAKVRAYRHRTR